MKKIVLCFAIIIFSIVDSSHSVTPDSRGKETPNDKEAEKSKVPKNKSGGSDSANTSNKQGTFSTIEGELEIGFYNVENLFDIELDLGKNDWEFFAKKLSRKKGSLRIN